MYALYSDDVAGESDNYTTLELDIVGFFSLLDKLTIFSWAPVLIDKIDE